MVCASDRAARVQDSPAEGPGRGVQAAFYLWRFVEHGRVVHFGGTEGNQCVCRPLSAYVLLRKDASSDGKG